MIATTWVLILIAVVVLTVVGVFVFPFVLTAFLKSGLSQSGEYAQWHMTVEHHASVLPSPNDYWTVAITYIEEIGGNLSRSWNSHGSNGDRLNREYELEGQKILLEYDRWNGFTISGKTETAQPLAESITTLVENGKATSADTSVAD